MIEFIYAYAKVTQIPSIIKSAGISRNTYGRWRDKESSPTVVSCIKISRAISKQYNLEYDELIVHCLKSVMTYR